MTLDRDSISEFISLARQATVIAVDTETTGLKITTVDHATGLSMAFMHENVVYAEYFPFNHVDEYNNIDDDFKQVIKEIIETVDTVVFHHAKFDLPSLETLGIYRTGKFVCTLVLSHLINENKPWNGKSLEALSAYYLGPEYKKAKMPGFDEFVAARGWGAVPYVMMKEYGAQDAVLTLLLIRKLWPLFLEECDASVWNRKQKLIRVLIDMNKRGVRVDVKKCRDLIQEGEQAMREAQNALNGINPASPSQLKELLIDKLGLPVLKWTDPPKGKDPALHVPRPSFTKDVMPDYERLLEEIEGESATAQNILTYRGWQKSVSSFYSAWISLLSPDGRLRPNYVMHKDPEDGGTVTGRLSCREPNLQQIPKVKKSPWNKHVKECFIPADGYVLIEADYSQLELRLGTAYAKEESLKRVFEEGRDIFDEMSVRMGLTRDETKTFVYSTQYGAGINRLMNVFHKSKSEAFRMRQNYYDAYPGFRSFSERASLKAKVSGKVKLWSGRYRHFLKPQEENHKAMNSVIQGGAADVVESVMIRCHEEIVNDDCRLLLQVHDSLVFEIREEFLMEYLRKIKDVMEGVNEYVFNFGVKFAVDIHYFGGEKIGV